MNRICLFAKFSELPSETEREAIEDKLSSILYEVYPQGDQKVVSGSGSWWIVISTILGGSGKWFLQEFAGWSVGKGLDNLAERAIRGVC